MFGPVSKKHNAPPPQKNADFFLIFISNPNTLEHFIFSDEPRGDIRRHRFHHGEHKLNRPGRGLQTWT